MWPAAAVRTVGVGGGMCSAGELLRGGAGGGGECDEDRAAPAEQAEEREPRASPRRRRRQDEGEQVSAGRGQAAGHAASG